eukprot:885257_1
MSTYYLFLRILCAAVVVYGITNRTEYELILRLKDINNGSFSQNLSITGLENENEPNANAYSIIGLLDTNLYTLDDGTFQFKLNYTNNPGSVDELIWKQSSWLNETGISGYEPIQVVERPDINWSQQFLGLGLSDYPLDCYLDGNGETYDNWNCLGPFSYLLSHWRNYTAFPGFNLHEAISQSLHIATTKYSLILRLKNVSEGLFSTELRENGLENEDNQGANTYSVIGNVNTVNVRDYDGKYKFKLIYVDKYGAMDVLIWKQSSWITETSGGKGNEYGVTPTAIEQ